MFYSENSFGQKLFFYLNVKSFNSFKKKRDGDTDYINYKPKASPRQANAD